MAIAAAPSTVASEPKMTMPRGGLVGGKHEDAGAHDGSGHHERGCHNPDLPWLSHDCPSSA